MNGMTTVKGTDLAEVKIEVKRFNQDMQEVKSDISGLRDSVSSIEKVVVKLDVVASGNQKILESFDTLYQRVNLVEKESIQRDSKLMVQVVKLGAFASSAMVIIVLFKEQIAKALGL